MNTNQNEEGAKPTITKPVVIPKNIHYTRTLSAQPTLSDPNQSSITSSQLSIENKEAVKLNTNAPVFVPKVKRDTTLTPSKQDTKESTNSTTVPSTTTTTTQPTYSGQGYQIPVQGYQSKILKITLNLAAQKNLNQTSFVPYTYLNQQPQPMHPGFTPSPNQRLPTGQFFPQPGMPYQNFPYKMPMYPITGAPIYNTPLPYTPMTPNTNTNTPQTQTQGQPLTITPTSTTTTTPAPLTAEKKVLFNKDSKSFIPKYLRDKQAQEGKEGETKASVTEVTPTTLTTEEKVKELSVIVPAETKKETIKKVEETEAKIEQPITTTETTTTTTEPKKVEKKSRLTDFLEKPIVTATKPVVAAAKKVATPSTVITTPLKPKVNDVKKTFEEKSKQLMNQQKTQSKPYTPLPVKKGILPPINLLLAYEQREYVKEETVKAAKEESPIPSDEEDIDDEVITKPVLPVEKFYFIKDGKSSKNNIYDINYLLSFKSWKICNEQTLLNDMLKDHLNKMKIWEDERQKGYKADKKGGRSNRDSYMSERGGQQQIQRSTIVPVIEDKTSFTRSTIKLDTPLIVSGSGMDLGKWGRKDMSEAERLAQEFKTKFEESRKLDPVRNELTELLNILTVDNYDEVKQSIFEKIKDQVENQMKFLEVLFKKAVSEKSFVSLYAKICKDLDREVPQKNEKDPRTSQMRAILVDKCREIFKTDNSKVDQYIKVSDPEEREAKLKKFLLGNVNFIGELINAKLLSKKIVFQCINNLLVRIEKQDEDQKLIKQINVEAIVILMDKFGTLINKHDAKMKPDELYDFNAKIDGYLNKLHSIQEADENLPGHIRYKIINLIEKRNRGWEESKVDKSSVAKGMKEVREDHENDQRTPGARSNKLDQEIVNNKIRDDLYAWRDHVRNGYAAEDYHWEITDALVRKHKNSVADILTAFGENCIDFIGKEDDIHTAYLYFREIINYFGPRLERKDKMELLDVTLYFLQNLNDFSLDNNLLVHVWGGIIYLLESYRIFNFLDLDKLKDVNEDQLKTMFEVINTCLSYYSENRAEKITELSNNVNLIKNNQVLFQSIVGNTEA